MVRLSVHAPISIIFPEDCQCHYIAADRPAKLVKSLWIDLSRLYPCKLIPHICAHTFPLLLSCRSKKQKEKKKKKKRKTRK